MSKTLQHLLLSIGSGLALGQSWPTEGFTFLIFVALIPLLFLEHSIRSGVSKRKSLRIFGYGYLSFLVWNLITTWWLINSTLFGMLFANLCNSLFYALLLCLFSWSKTRLPLRSAYIFFVCLWLAFEKLHLIWDFSWTWLNLGNVFSEKIYWIQWYEYTGTFGGTLWVLILNLWLFSILKNNGFNSANLLLKKSVAPLLAIALPIALSLYLYQKVANPKKTIEVLMMQPNIDPYSTKYQLTNKDFLEQFIQQSQVHLSPDIDYMLSPETYFAEGYGEALANYNNSEIHKDIQKSLKDYPELQWISGIQFYDTYVQKDAPSFTANQVRENLWVEYYNSALSEQFQQNPEVYHKSKLVVGVENMPFKAILKPFLGDLMIDLGGTVSSRVVQKNRAVFTHPMLGEKAAPIICWESVFGEYVTEYIQKGATFLAIISNDAWWGETPGHKQLLSYTRLRAIETRRDIARSANTGISAIIDARGEVLKQTKYNSKTVLKGSIASRSEITFYARYGDLIARWATLLTTLLLLLAISGRLKST